MEYVLVYCRRHSRRNYVLRPKMTWKRRQSEWIYYSLHYFSSEEFPSSGPTFSPLFLWMSGGALWLDKWQPATYKLFLKLDTRRSTARMRVKVRTFMRLWLMIWLFGSMIDCLIYWYIHRWIDWLVDWLIKYLMDWLFDWLITEITRIADYGIPMAFFRWFTDSLDCFFWSYFTFFNLCLQVSSSETKTLATTGSSLFEVPKMAVTSVPSSGKLFSTCTGTSMAELPKKL